MQIPTFKVCEWIEPHFRPINKFYKSQKHKGKANGNERVFCVLNNDIIVGAVRLEPLDGYYWLRSLYIEQQYKRSGLGSQLLTVVRQNIVGTIYCFPYDYLEGFYRSNHYEIADTQHLPESLDDLFKRYSGRGEKIIAMKSHK